MLNNYQELSSETETTVRLDIYEQNETNFVFLHAVLTEILKAEKKYCSIDFFAFSVSNKPRDRSAVVVLSCAVLCEAR